MSINIFQEAVIEARQLRELAENNAKNKILEAVTPRIQRLIEAELVGEEEDSEGSDSMDMEMPDEASPEPDTTGGESIDLSSLATPAMSDPSSKLSISVQGDLNLNLEGDKSRRNLILNKESLNRSAAKSRILKLAGKAINLQEALKGVDLRNVSATERKTAILYYGRLLHEAATLLGSNIVMTESRGSRLKRLLDATLLEIKNMANRRDTAAFKKLFLEMVGETGMHDEGMHDEMYEADDEEGGDELDLGDDEGGDEDMGDEGGDVDVDAVKSAIEQLAGAVGMEVSASDEEGGEEEEEGGEEETVEEAVRRATRALVEARKKKTNESDKKKAEAKKKKEADKKKNEAKKKKDEAKKKNETRARALRAMGLMEGASEDEVDECDDGDMMEAEDEAAEDEKVYEIDESMIRRELGRLRNLRESRRPVSRRGRRLYEGEAVAAAGSFGGGEVGDEMFVDVDEDTLLNALVDEIGDAPVPKKMASESRRRTASAERRAQVAEAAADKLKRQISEMNLFNAKLLFANKLMQNRELSNNQQRAVVEALDGAKTIREAKLLYESLSSSLRKSSTSGSLTESNNRLLASSSRSTRSGAPANSGVEVDRWATLAGIRNGGE